MINLSDDKQLLQIWASCIALLLVVFYRWPGRQLDHIPAVGSTSPIFSFIGAVQFFYNAWGVIQRGCEMYSNGIFRIPRFRRWVVVVHRSELVKDIKKAPEHVLSSIAAIKILIQPQLIFGQDIFSDPYHNPLVRTELTRNLRDIFPAIYEELVASLGDYIPATESGWLKLRARTVVMPILCRATNRMFVGFPLCRDPEWIDLNIRFTRDLGKAHRRLRNVPPFLRPLVATWFTNTVSDIACGVKHIRPLVEARQQKVDENDPNRPNDFLTWMMEVKDKDHNVEELARRILRLNIAAIHTLGATFCHALFRLAEHPEYADTLREEVETIVSRNGWTQAATVKMVKVDSFIKESQRLDTMKFLGINRVVCEPFTFSDGTHLPVGTLVSVASHAIHTDESNYTNPLVFEPFRFVDKTRQENIGRKVDMAATHADYLPFGYGLHACPGRFFAAHELKLLLALIVTKYDVMFENKVRPQNVMTANMCSPDWSAEVMFRRRMG